MATKSVPKYLELGWKQRKCYMYAESTWLFVDRIWSKWKHCCLIDGATIID